MYLAIILVGGVLVWKGSDLLESSAEQLSAYYGLPAVVHGTIVIAVGSSFPELSSTVLATLLHGEFELGMSTVVGSAIFNILVIPGLSGLASKNGLATDRDLVFRDAQFYITSVAVLIITFCLAVVYHPQPNTPLTGFITPWLAIVPLALYGLYIFIQAQEVKDAKQPRDKSVNPVKAWAVLILSLVLIVGGVEGLVSSAIFLGDYFHTPSFLWGILVIATVTSIPDAIISVRLARKGDGVASLGNVLGSNIFDLLVAIPLGIIIVGTPVLVDLEVAVPLFAVLTMATILLFVSMRLRLGLSRMESWVLLTAYGVFTLWIILETLGYLNFLPDNTA